MSQILSDLLRKPEEHIFLVLVACAAILIMALGLQYIGGFQPCELCLKERWAYYADIVLAVLAMAALSSGRSGVGAGLMALAGVFLLANAGLGLYHAGVEWHWWQGPSTCTMDSNGLAGSGDQLLKSLETENVVRCDQPAMKILGLSLAAWNVPIGLALGAVSGLAAWRLSRTAGTV